MNTCSNGNYSAELRKQADNINSFLGPSSDISKPGLKICCNVYGNGR